MHPVIILRAWRIEQAISAAVCRIDYLGLCCLQLIMGLAPLLNCSAS
jgi:hypothetical protein